MRSTSPSSTRSDENRRHARCESMTPKKSSDIILRCASRHTVLKLYRSPYPASEVPGSRTVRFTLSPRFLGIGNVQPQDLDN